MTSNREIDFRRRQIKACARAKPTSECKGCNAVGQVRLNCSNCDPLIRKINNFVKQSNERSRARKAERERQKNIQLIVDKLL